MIRLTRSIKLFFAVLAVAACAGSSACALTLAANSKTNYVIVIASDASKPEKTAASELQSYLQQVTGAEFQIQSEAEVDADEPQILVGQSSRAKRLAPDVNWPSLGQDGIIIRTVGNNLILAGGAPRGTIYAVYTFLEDTIGCRWWTSTESTIPSKKTLCIPALNINYKPKLIYREAFYRDLNENPLFDVKLKMNGFFYNIPEEYGGHIRFLGFVHTTPWMLDPNKNFKDHPEWFAEIDGKRTIDNSQLCWSNPEMCKELTKVTLNAVKSDPTAGIISVSQNDNLRRCQCVNCKAIEEEEGSPSGPIIRCINTIADEVGKYYPNVLIETLAYNYSRKPPKLVKPRNNVIIRLCTIEADFAKPLDSDANKEMRDDILGWKAIAPNLFVWDYVTSFKRYIQPHPNFRVLAPNIRFFVNNNTIGLFEQGDSESSIGDFVRLRAWLFAHLEWNPNLDDKKLITEFLNGYYGPAAPSIQQYIDLYCDAIEKSGMVLGCYNTSLDFFTLPVMNKSVELWDKAEKAVASDPVLAERVHRDRMPLDFAWLMRFNDLKKQAEADKTTLAGPTDPAKAMKEYIAEARKWNAGAYCEGWPFEAEVPKLETMFMTVPTPEELGKIPAEDRFEITPDMFRLYLEPERVRLIDDPLASTGKAAYMPGKFDSYGVQFQITDELVKRLEGNWKIFVVARCEAGDGYSYLRTGVVDRSLNKSIRWTDKKVEKAWDGKYMTYYSCSINLTSNMYIWVAATGYPERTKAIYVDKIVLVRDK